MPDKNYVAKLKNAYTLLGVSPRASKEEIRHRYKILSKKYHPDRNPTLDTTKQFQELGAAYELLIKESDTNQGVYEGTDEDNSTEATFKNNTTYHSFGDWRIVSRATSFNVYHPKFSPLCDSMAFWNITSSKPCVALPADFNINIRQKVKRSLYPLIDEQRLFREVCSYNDDDDYEVIIYLATSPVIRGEMIRKICNIYSMPDEVVCFIKDRMNVEFLVHSFKNENPSFKHQNSSSWEIISTGAHLFVSHPSLRGVKDNITFWNFNDIERQVTLPVNYCDVTHKKISENLSRYVSPLNDNDAEITLDFLADNVNLIIDAVAIIYCIPEFIMMRIKNSFGMTQHMPTPTTSNFYRVV